MTDLQQLPSPDPAVSGWHPDPAGEAEERYWDAVWTDHTRNGGQEPTATQVAAAPLSGQPSDLDQRKAVLAERVAYYVGYGYRPESQTETQAVMVSGHRPNHILHLILTILTGGLWGIFVWLPIAVFGGEKRKVITVDEYGRALETKG